MRTRKPGAGLEWVLPKEYRRDKWVCDVLGTCDGTLSETVLKPARQLAQELLLNGMSLRQLRIEERLCGIVPPFDATIAERKAAVGARWKAVGKMSLRQLQEVCDSWNDKFAEVFYENNRLRIRPIVQYISRDDINLLKIQMEDVRPAHIPLDYLFRFLIPLALQMNYRMRYYGKYDFLIELNNRKTLDGTWRLGQVSPGFAFPLLELITRVKHRYHTENLAMLDGSDRLDGGWKLHYGYAPMAFITRFWNNYKELQCAVLEVRAVLQNPCGEKQKAKLRFGARYQNIITYYAPEMRFHAQVTNKCGSMNGTLQKGSTRKMNGTYKFNGAITFNKTQSTKEEI